MKVQNEIKSESFREGRDKSFLCKKANPTVDRVKQVIRIRKKSISFNLEQVLKYCNDFEGLDLEWLEPD